MTDTSPPRPYRLYGLRLSYFTGKLQAYFRAKGIPHDYVEMTSADFNRCAKATGIRQMPQVECPDGTWLTDTTNIIQHFETQQVEPRIRPADKAIGFLSLLLEDFCDEWLWRPALYYRWVFKEDRTLMSSQIARTMMRDMKLPFFMRQRFILARQRRVYLKEDGVTRQTSPQIEALFHKVMEVLEGVLSKHDFLFGGRPCEADYGLMGPFFRHFSYDPTPSMIMREKAPYTLAWVGRMWAITPEAFRNLPSLERVPEELRPLFDLASSEYLPYLENNASAVEQSKKNVHYQQDGVPWKVPASPYRADCLSALKATFAALTPGDQAVVASWLSGGAQYLESPTPTVTFMQEGRTLSPVDRHGL